jgi:hypothetical protein
MTLKKTKKAGDDRVSVDRESYNSMKEVVKEAVKKNFAGKDQKTGQYYWMYNPKAAEYLKKHGTELK